MSDAFAVTEKVSASTRIHALAARLFRYRHVTGRDIGNVGEVIRARQAGRLHLVMTCEEVKAVLGALDRRQEVDGRAHVRREVSFDAWWISFLTCHPVSCEGSRACCTGRPQQP